MSDALGGQPADAAAYAAVNDGRADVMAAVLKV